MERLIKNVIIGINNLGYLNLKTNEFVKKAIETKFERLTYQACIQDSRKMVKM